MAQTSNQATTQTDLKLKHPAVVGDACAVSARIGSIAVMGAPSLVVMLKLHCAL